MEAGFITSISLLVCFFHALSGVNSQSTLQLLQIVHNPGHATPQDTFPNDPNRGILKQFGYGQLTNMGKTEEYRLGQFIRKRYGSLPTGFVSEYYKHSEMVARSVNQDLALASAQLLLAGLYPPKGNQIWNAKMKWQPIPVHATPLDADILLAPSNLSHMIDTAKRKQINRLNKDFYNDLSHLCGMEVKDAEQVAIIDKALQFAELNKLAYPSWALDEDLRMKISEVSNADFSLRLENTQQQMFTSGTILNEIVRSIDNKTQLGSEYLRKINIFTTGDLVLSGLLTLLNISSGIRPTPASAIFIQLHSEPFTKQQIIKVFFKNGTWGDAVPVPVPFCGDPCTVQIFSTWTNEATSQFRAFSYNNNFNLMSVNNRTNKEEVVTVTVTITMTTVIVIAGLILLAICTFVCCWACCRRRQYIRLY